MGKNLDSLHENIMNILDEKEQNFGCQETIYPGWSVLKLRHFVSVCVTTSDRWRQLLAWISGTYRKVISWEISLAADSNALVQ